MWDDASVATRAQQCLSRFGAGRREPGHIDRILDHAESVQRAIAASRARVGQPPVSSFWPRGPLREVYALKDAWNDMFYFGRTDAEWTGFEWWTTV